MKAHVVGFQSCDFKDREGKQVQGVSLKCVVDYGILLLIMVVNIPI